MIISIQNEKNAFQKPLLARIPNAFSTEIRHGLPLTSFEIDILVGIFYSYDHTT